MWNEHIEGNWEEYYSIYPASRKDHTEKLEYFSTTDLTATFGKFANNVSKNYQTKYWNGWLSVAIHHNHTVAISKILNVLNVPDIDMTMKERISYHQLTQEYTDE